MLFSVNVFSQDLNMEKADTNKPNNVNSLSGVVVDCSQNSAKQIARDLTLQLNAKSKFPNI